MKITSIIVAAGLGRRMEEETSKPYLLLNNKPIIYYTLLKFSKVSEINEIILVVEEKKIEFCKEEIIKRYKLNKVKKVISGGRERQDSVFNGLKEVEKDTHFVLIHDGVRPFIEIKLIKEIISKVKKEKAVTFGRRVSDTLAVKGRNLYISKNLERKNIYTLETPQAFEYSLIWNAYQKAYKDRFYGYDDSSLVVRMGEKVKILENRMMNMKITYKEDLLIGEHLTPFLEINEIYGSI
jgi:2-C-methyl-D-erythritol 4-phosphate cytidylyltransferase